MALVDEKVSYLEMMAPGQHSVLPPRAGLTVVQAQPPTVSFYRFLYNAVGGAYHWCSRGKLTDAELATILNDPFNEVHVLYAGGVPAGFAELDCRNPSDVELVQFGLLPEFIGQGLGKFFLRWTIDQVWRRQPKRLWLHTCNLDHPAALPNYLKAGFRVFKEETKKCEIPG